MVFLRVFPYKARIHSPKGITDRKINAKREKEVITMLNAEKILKLMDEYKFDDVRKLCLSEIAAKMNKEKGGKSVEKAVKVIEKYTKQRCSKGNPALRGWFKVDIGLDGYYCVCDRYTAILLDTEKVADLPFEQSEGMNVSGCFLTDWEGFEKIEIKEEELKAVHKNARNFTNTFSVKGSKGIIVKFGEMEIDTERMAEVVLALGSGTLFKNPNNKGACVYDSDMGIGLILPLNPRKEDGIKQYSEYVEMIKANL